MVNAERGFRDKSIIVTGALGAIGSACAKIFASEGACLVLADLASALGNQAVPAAIAACAASGTRVVLATPCDAGKEDDVKATVELALERFGRLDGIVNVAGATTFNAIERLTAEDWQKAFATNFLGAAYFTKAAFNVMGQGGVIINIASVHAFQTSPGLAPYAAAKAALLSLTRSTAIEGKPKGIRANAVVPGAIDTPMLWSNPNVASGAEKLHDIGRPVDVAEAVAYLASDAARFVTGSILTVDGGRMARL